MTPTPPRPVPPALPAGPPAGDAPALSATEQRMAWLFRDATRAGLVHPLRALVEHYRAGDLA